MNTCYARCVLVVAAGVAATLSAIAQQEGEAMPGLSEFESARNEAYARQLEAYLRDWLVEQYPERAAEGWNRDYSSVDAFVASVEPNRQRWRDLLNPPELPPSGDPVFEPHPYMAELGAQWLRIPLGMLDAEALVAVPANADGPVPLVIAQHGIGSFPERAFGLEDTGGAYHEYARELLDAGFAVLAPFNLRTVELRNRIERLCRLADTTLPGIEFTRLQHLLDVVLEDPRIDAERVGMWGVSLGGMATMFWMPLEPRIQAGVVCAWFNHRCTKMAVPDERYTSFIETREEHAFFRGWLTQFADYDAICLICPRPVLVQHGKQDRIAWWPDVVAEFEAASAHYEKLGLEDRIEIDLHEGGHEAVVESGVRFLRQWLMPPP